LSFRLPLTRGLGRPLAALLTRALPLLPGSVRRGIARTLVTADPPTGCDALVLLGGGGLARVDWAVALWRRLQPPVIVVFSSIDPTALDSVGAKTTADILCRAGLPPERIRAVPEPVTTFDEALYLRRTAPDRQRLLIVTDWYHTRRAGLTLRRALRGRDVTCALTCATPSDEALTAWVHSTDLALAVTSELPALALYRLLGRI
jgi:uncharacterized SAM-binding protein YcdF (DUF218 family)